MKRTLIALDFAARRHVHHRRKGHLEAPYVNHLIEVATLLATHDVDDPVTLCAAVLHDTIEDVDVTEEEIRERFGDVVAEVVLEVTDPPNATHKVRHDTQLRRAKTMSEAAQNIKVADKISNLRGILTSPPRGWTLARKLEYFDFSEALIERCALANADLKTTFRSVYVAGRAALLVSHDDGYSR